MLVGRQQEIDEMLSYLEGNNAHLLMLTGRRRVGKTYLVNEVYKNYMLFSFTGTKDASIENQVQKFHEKLEEFSGHNRAFPKPTKWSEALRNLKTYCSSFRKNTKKKVIFLDEFPWIQSHNSNFFNEFSYWWNDWASMQNIVVVISGSATTWMIQKVIGDRGGMHNRVTRRIHLQPFTLAETKSLVLQINPHLSDYDILELYMCLGGIPMYLNQIKKGESTAQSIYNICFKKTGFLYNEFNELYASLFDNFQNHLAVIRALSTKWIGLSRTELVSLSKLPDGGGLTRILTELESCNFIQQIIPFQNKKKGAIYRLVDEYSRFYIHFIETGKRTMKNWLSYQTSSSTYKAWQGYAFENICIKHTEAVKAKLGIAGIHANVCSYYFPAKQIGSGIQIDMLIDRADKAVNICEIKFYSKEIKLTQSFSDELRIRRAKFIELSKTKKSVFNTVISTFGFDKSEYISSEIDTEVTMYSLFKQIRFE